MSKKISRIMILSFFLIVTSISYHINLLLLSMFGCFWLGFVVSAIIFKEMDNIIFWVASKGIPTGLLTKEEDENDERTKKENDGKTEREA